MSSGRDTRPASRKAGARRAKSTAATSTTTPSPVTAKRTRPHRKLIEIEPDILQALEWLARDRMQDFQELADEAFRDVLKKHRRPVTLKEALRQSTRTPANDER